MRPQFKQMETVISRKFVGPARWILVCCCLLIVLYGFALCYQGLTDHEGTDYLVIVIGGGFGLVGLAGTMVIPRQRSVVTETYVEKRRLLSTRIDFDSVVWVRLHLGEMILSDGSRRVAINRVAENGRQLFAAAAEQITRRPAIELRGDPETLAIHFGPRNTTSENK